MNKVGAIALGLVFFFASTAAEAVSADGTTIPGATQILDAQGNTWALSCGAAMENGLPERTCSPLPATLLLIFGGTLYEQDSAQNWWSWSGTSWTMMSGDPRSGGSNSGSSSSSGSSGSSSSSSGSSSGGTANVNGVCGSANGQTFSTLSSTSPNLCTSGTLTSFQSESSSWIWACQGSVSGNTAGCFALASSSSSGSSSSGGGASLPGTRNFLVGINSDHIDNPTFSAMVGYPPDFTEGWAGGGAPQTALACDGEAWNPPSGASAGYPLILTAGHFDPSILSAADAAANNSNAIAAWARFVSTIGPYAGQIYAIRVDHEWQGNWYDYSPFIVNGVVGSSPAIIGGVVTGYLSPSVATYFNNPVIPAATFVAGFQNFVTYLRAHGFANVKIEWDYAGSTYEQAWYPGDAYVDIIGLDAYFTNQTASTSAATWAAYNSTSGTGGSGYGSLPNLAAFAAAHNKPLAFPEWADGFGDGYCTAQFASWIEANNVVFEMYWDAPSTLSPVPLQGALQETTANQQAYIDAFANLRYTGTFWPKILPVPSSLPPGF